MRVSREVVIDSMIKISPRSKKMNKSDVFWEYIMVFIVAFVSLYGLTLFTSMQSGSSLIDSFTSNQFVFIVVGLFLAIGITIVYYLYNRSKKLIVSVTFDSINKLLILEMTPKYSSVISECLIPYGQLRYSINKLSAWFLGYNYSLISFYDNNKKVGTISTAENWEDEAIAIRELIEGLKIAGNRKN